MDGWMGLVDSEQPAYKSTARAVLIMMMMIMMIMKMTMTMM